MSLRENQVQAVISRLPRATCDFAQPTPQP